MLNKLKMEIEQKMGCKIIWELGKKDVAINSETGEVVAIYDPKTGSLRYTQI